MAFAVTVAATMAAVTRISAGSMRGSRMRCGSARRSGCMRSGTDGLRPHVTLPAVADVDRGTGRCVSTDVRRCEALDMTWASADADGRTSIRRP